MEKTSYFNPKITAEQFVKNLLQTVQFSTGAIFNANNVQQQKLTINYTILTLKNEHARKSNGDVLNKQREKDLESKFKPGFN